MRSMNWTETETVVTICTGIVTLTQFLLWRYIAKIKAYEAEKGKNLATKEDIKEITKMIEEAKAISSISNSIDVHLLRLLVIANESIEYERRMSFDGNHEGYAFNALFSLCSYLERFKHRYNHNQNASNLIHGYEELFSLEKSNEVNNYFETPRYDEIVNKLKPNIDKLLKLMMPKYQR